LGINLLENKGESDQETMLSWFLKAMKSYKTPEHFNKKIEGFTILANRSHAFFLFMQMDS
jgi:hypothetical protein